MKSDDKNRPPDPHLRGAAETERVDQPSAGAAGRSAEELLHELRVDQTFNRYCNGQPPPPETLSD